MFIRLKIMVYIVFHEKLYIRYISIYKIPKKQKRFAIYTKKDILYVQNCHTAHEKTLHT
jgi:hypothetical protein